jgi:hypothetical protein
VAVISTEVVGAVLVVGAVSVVPTLAADVVVLVVVPLLALEHAHNVEVAAVRAISRTGSRNIGEVSHLSSGVS